MRQIRGDKIPPGYNSGCFGPNKDGLTLLFPEKFVCRGCSGDGYNMTKHYSRKANRPIFMAWLDYNIAHLLNLRDALERKGWRDA